MLKENYKEKRVTPQVIPPPPKSIYDDKYADKETRKSTYDNMSESEWTTHLFCHYYHAPNLKFINSKIIQFDILCLSSVIIFGGSSI